MVFKRSYFGLFKANSTTTVIFFLIIACKCVTSEPYDQNKLSSHVIKNDLILANATKSHPIINKVIHARFEVFSNVSNYSYFSNKNFTAPDLVLTKELLQRILLSIIYFLIIISCLVGNSLVIIAVVIVRKLHTKDNASNYLIVSLAVSDLLVGVLVMPYAFYVEMSEENK